MVNRGAKKDFWDIAYLLNEFNLSEILEYYQRKYKNSNFWQVEKTICYFKDADEELVEIVDFQNQTWESIKEKIKQASKANF